MSGPSAKQLDHTQQTSQSGSNDSILPELGPAALNSSMTLWSNPNHLVPRSPQGSDSLAHERSKSTFNSEELCQFLHGGREKLERIRYLTKLIEADPVFAKENRHFMGRTERFKEAMKKAVRVVELQREQGWTDEDWWTAQKIIDEPGPFFLHHSMFLPTLRGQASEEQQAKLLPLAENMNIIGCYAQTELGHGSNIQGLETTATYIPETQQFELHSPTLTSAKWWAGGLGRTATHAIVVARLISKGKDYGTHTFCVQIRSLEDFRPLTGITIGDVGPKYGFHCVDNGFMLFNKVRVPRDNMLMRFARIEPDGSYVRPPNNKLSYGTMVYVRTNIVINAASAIARAAVIATRYSAVRRQFTNNEASVADPLYKAMNEDIEKANLSTPDFPPQKPAETAVIDYPIQANRLFTSMSKAYALHFTGRMMLDLYTRLQNDLAKNKLTLLPETHATSSGLKSVTTDMAAEVLEDLRRSCGGHGFSQFSGFPDFITSYLPNVTYEGDNHLLTQQTTRYLLKTYTFIAQTVAKPGGRMAVMSKVKTMTPTTRYIAAAAADSDFAKKTMQFPVSWGKNTSPVATDKATFANIILSAFAHRAGKLVRELGIAIASKQTTWTQSLTEIHRICYAHCHFIMVESFFKGVGLVGGNEQTSIVSAESAAAPFEGLSPETRNTLQNLSFVFSLNLLTSGNVIADLLSSSTPYLTPQQLSFLRHQFDQASTRVRPDAIALTDAWGFSDYVLNSALGRSDGKVYEALYDGASREPLNVGENFEVVGGYAETVGASLKGQKIDWANVDAALHGKVKAKL